MELYPPKKTHSMTIHQTSFDEQSFQCSWYSTRKNHKHDNLSKACKFRFIEWVYLNSAFHFAGDGFLELFQPFPVGQIRQNFSVHVDDVVQVQALLVSRIAILEKSFE